MNKSLIIKDGWLIQVERFASPHFSPREAAGDISLLVLHNISLPAGQFGANYINELFLGQLRLLLSSVVC